FCRAAGLALPRRLAVEHRQHAGIGSVVVLHRAGVAAHELVAGLALLERNVCGKGAVHCARRRADHRDDRHQATFDRCHSTVMVACSVAENPLSPVHLNSSVPLAVATVLNAMTALAPSVGWTSARNISWPLSVHTKRLMMSRGIALPMLSWRKPVSISCEISVLIAMISPFLAVFGTLMSVRAIIPDPPGRPRW